MIKTTLSLALCLASLAACNSSTAADDGEGGHASTGATMSSSTGQAACAETDLKVGIPFSGPGWDSTNNTIVGTPQSSYVVVTTWITLKPGTENEFLTTSTKAIGAALSNPGLVGLTVASSAECGTARTITVWKDAAAMMEFVTGDEHMACEAILGKVSSTASTVSWTDAPTDLPPTFDQAMTHLEGVKAFY